MLNDNESTEQVWLYGIQVKYVKIINSKNSRVVGHQQFSEWLWWHQ